MSEKVVYSEYDLVEAIRTEREKIAKTVKEFLMNHYLVTSGDKYRLNADDHAKLDKILKGGEEASPNGEPLSSPQQAEGYPAEEHRMKRKLAFQGWCLFGSKAAWMWWKSR